ncbi:Putative Flp pilus-assembly TadE/G-like [Roseovarius lutimaris]|uniref:Putative Flp pilus-assembly TadE/G-like n=1 Tax=Roseovarius lutimaris TaxID=1005928 RepID=A0A1I4ZIC3_9RHOB|nr:pilus assembly protein TadG-related protein [Roseovarius lutimaris]SFN50012.1 Putative Flp pilus-assembly TadE/G-like [Roseovarius lutimaris]
MFPRQTITRLRDDESGSILLLGAVTLVLMLGMVGFIFDFGRKASTHAELQNFADSVSLAAAAELDGRADAITRARHAADTLIADHQTFAQGARLLGASDIVEITFYKPDELGGFSGDASHMTENAHSARFVSVRLAERSVLAGLSGAFRRYTGDTSGNDDVGAYAAAGFSLEACNVAPVAVCLPTLDFDASTSVGQTLELDANITVGLLQPGQIRVVDTLTDSLDGLSVCANLLGGALDACLLAARQPETACTGQGGLKISANLDGSNLLNALNTRFGQFSGIAGGLLGNPDFSGAPSVLQGVTDTVGLCQPLGADAGDPDLPVDDCISDGGCGVQGDGNWQAGRLAYIDAHYGGTDPHPEANTRFEFYKAELNASGNVQVPDSLLSGLGGLLGGLTNGLLGGDSGPIPNYCMPQQNTDPNRRLMVVAGIDCLSANVDASVSTAPVQQFFEVFNLGPGQNGKLQVEITACLGGDCGKGNLDTEVVEVVRLVE